MTSNTSHQSPARIVLLSLVYRENPADTFALKAIVTQDDRLEDNAEMHGWFMEGTQQGSKQRFDALLVPDDVSDRQIRFMVEWENGDTTETFVDFVARPLAVGQHVWRTDTVEQTPERSCYEIVSIDPVE